MDNEKRFLDSMRQGDLAKIDDMLNSNLITPNQVIDNRSILLYAIDCGSPDMVTSLIDHGADVSQDDFKPLVYSFINLQDLSVNAKKVGIRIVEIIFRAMQDILNDTDIIMAVFVPIKGHLHFMFDNDDYGLSLFMLAVRWNLDPVISIFLQLITDRSNPIFQIDWFMTDRGYNPFHYAPDLRLSTLAELIEKLPFSRILINSKDRHSETTPLYTYIVGAVHFPDYADRLTDHIRMMLTKGSADPHLDDGLVHLVITYEIMTACERRQNISILELLLRAGCRTDIIPFKYAVSGNLKRAVQLLLAFGVDLSKEPYLYDDDEMPEEFKTDEYESERSTSYINPHLLKALKELRRSNQLNSLKYLCRKSIRHHLKPNADAVIRGLDMISPAIKSFLLVENEPGIIPDDIWGLTSIADGWTKYE